ncbi:hypothetical protein Scep_027277 [Stephania cephalantha]|uniref:Uncharacterized protein n=1 Tax=Stephania cephalantha TaxID=152367 RepID=A0AAP0E7L3_9MAGN
MMSDKVVGDNGLMMKPTKGEVVEKLMLGLIPDEEVKMLIKYQLQRRTDWIYSHNFEQRFALLHNFVESLKEKSVVTETKDFNGDAHDFPISFAKLISGEHSNSVGLTLRINQPHWMMLKKQCWIYIAREHKLKMVIKFWTSVVDMELLPFMLLASIPNAMLLGLLDTTSLKNSSKSNAKIKT